MRVLYIGCVVVFFYSAWFVVFVRRTVRGQTHPRNGRRRKRHSFHYLFFVRFWLPRSIIASRMIVCASVVDLWERRRRAGIFFFFVDGRPPKRGIILMDSDNKKTKRDAVRNALIMRSTITHMTAKPNKQKTQKRRQTIIRRCARRKPTHIFFNCFWSPHRQSARFGPFGDNRRCAHRA